MYGTIPMNKTFLHLQLSIVFFLSTLTTSCDNSTSQPHKVDATSIVGEPIIDRLNPRSDEQNTSLVITQKRLEGNSSNVDRNQTAVREGLIVNGKVIDENDQNTSSATDYGVLPPMDEDSEYTPVAFRKLTQFKYEVDWETDGLNFNFPAYCQRVPKELRGLTASKVGIEGFMIPTIVDENNEVKEFLLLPDQMSCCFGQTPEANGWIVVTANEGVEVLMDRVIRVSGELTVEERWDEEFFVGLYHLTCEEITGPSL